MSLRPFRSPRIEVPPPNAALNLAHPLARELGAAWLFNEAAANLVRDAGPFGLDGTLFNSGGNLTKTPLGALNTSTVSLDRIEAPHHEILNRTTQSVAVLVRLRAVAPYTPSFVEKWSGGGYPLNMAMDTSGHPTAQCYDGGNFPIATCPFVVADNLLHVFVGVRVAGVSLSLYVDGVLVATVADTTTAPSTQNTAVYTIGNRFSGGGSARPPLGAIRGVWQWGRALSASETAAFSAAPFDMFATPARLLVPVGTAAGGSPVSASGAATLPHLTASGTGAALAKASGSATLPHFTASGAATSPHQASGAATLPHLTAVGTAQALAKATGTAQLPHLTASGTGSVGNAAHAAGAVTLPHLTASGTAQSPHAASGSTVLPHLTASGGAQALARAGGAVSLPHFVASGQAAALAKASGLAVLPMLRLTGTGHVQPIGAHDAALTGTVATRARLTGAVAAHAQLSGTVAARPRLTGTLTLRPLP